VSGILLLEGSNPIIVTAQDAAGNTSSATLTVTLDTVAPTIQITSPTTDPTYQLNSITADFVVSGVAADANGIDSLFWFSDRLGSFGACQGTTIWSTVGLSLLQGTNVITVTAIDMAGNTASDAITVFFNQESPVAVVTKFSFGWPLVTRYR
jgi:predicted secreted protein